MGNDELDILDLNLQKELEAKFDELFGPLEDAQEIEQEEKTETLSNSIRRQLEEEYNNLAECASNKYMLRNYKEVLSLWQQACDVAQQLNDIEKEMHCYYKICQNSYHLGYLKNALLTSFKVTKYYSNAAPSDLYGTIARQLHIAGALIIPRNCLERLLHQLKACNNRYHLEKQAGYLLDEACLQLDYCNPDKALPKAQRSKILILGNSGGYNLPSHLRILFLCYYLKADLEQMKRTITELQNCETNAELYKEYCLYFCRCLLFYMQGDYQSAYVNAGHALTLQRKSNINEYMVLYHLITIAAAWGRPEIAREYLIELIEQYRENRKNDKRYWQRYYTYRGLGHYYAAYAKIEQNTRLRSKYFHRSSLYYKRAMLVAKQIDDLLCISGWQQKVEDDLASLEGGRLPKPVLCER